MGKGYAEGPVAEEAEARLDELERGIVDAERPEERPAVYASTQEEAQPHFLGWLGEVDPDELFESGQAWGITVRRRAVDD